MALKYSTGFQNKLITGSSLNEIFGAGKLQLRSGAMPTAADDAITGTLLAEATLPATSGSAAPWSISGRVATLAGSWADAAADAAGTIGYFVLIESAGGTGATTTEGRIMGTVATSGGDMTVNTVTVSSTSDTVSFTSFTLTFPLSA